MNISMHYDLCQGISNLRLQMGCVSVQVWLARQVLFSGPSKKYPSKQLKLTVLLYWNNQPIRFPFIGDPGSPQLTANKSKIKSNK